MPSNVSFKVLPITFSKYPLCDSGVATVRTDWSEKPRYVPGTLVERFLAHVVFGVDDEALLAIAVSNSVRLNFLDRFPTPIALF